MGRRGSKPEGVESKQPGHNLRETCPGPALGLGRILEAWK